MFKAKFQEFMLQVIQGKSIQFEGATMDHIHSTTINSINGRERGWEGERERERERAYAEYL